jgi:hypothetical protein
VYAIGAALEADDLFVKFGISDHPARRLKSIETDSPMRVKLLVKMATRHRSRALQIEAAIHQALRSYHHQGEWFRAHPRVLLVVEMMRKHARAPNLFRAHMEAWTGLRESDQVDFSDVIEQAAL